eukprot:scaffold4511_cov171-Amphora_coffeaeformis.AAC.3
MYTAGICHPLVVRNHTTPRSWASTDALMSRDYTLKPSKQARRLYSRLSCQATTGAASPKKKKQEEESSSLALSVFVCCKTRAQQRVVFMGRDYCSRLEVRPNR